MKKLIILLLLISTFSLSACQSELPTAFKENVDEIYHINTTNLLDELNLKQEQLDTFSQLDMNNINNKLKPVCDILHKDATKSSEVAIFANPDNSQIIYMCCDDINSPHNKYKMTIKTATLIDYKWEYREFKYEL